MITKITSKGFKIELELDNREYNVLKDSPFSMSETIREDFLKALSTVAFTKEQAELALVVLADITYMIGANEEREEEDL